MLTLNPVHVGHRTPGASSGVVGWRLLEGGLRKWK